MRRKRHFANVQMETLARHVELAALAAVLTLPIAMSTFATDTPVTGTGGTTTGESTVGAAAQGDMPATPHQQQAVGAAGTDPEQKLEQATSGAATQGEMPATPHQQKAIGAAAGTDAERSLEPAPAVAGGTTTTGGTAGAPAQSDMPATPHQQQAVGAAAGTNPEKQIEQAPSVAGIPASPHQMQSLNDFGGVDANRDGRLDSSEYGAYRTKRTSVGEFGSADANGDGYISFVEVYYAEHPGEKPPSAGAESIKDVVERNSFKTLDANGDGRVSVQEATEGYMLSVNDKAVYDYQAADRDKDGLLDSQEFGAFQEALSKHSGS